MTWTAPATPVTLTVITVAFYNVNIRDNLNQLRANTGSADPGAVGLSLESDTATSAAWVGGKVARAGDTMTGPLTVPTGQGNGVNFGGSQIYEVGPGAGLLAKCAGNIFYVFTGNLLAEILRATYGGDLLFMGNKVWHEGNDGPASGLAAQTAGSATTAASASDSAALGGVAASGYALAHQAVSATQSAGYGLTTSYATVTGVSVTIPVLATWMVIVHSQGTLASTDGSCTARIHVAGSAVGPEPSYGLGENGRRSVGITFLGPISAGAVVDLRAKKASGTGGSSIDTSDIVAIRVG